MESLYILTLRPSFTKVTEGKQAQGVYLRKNWEEQPIDLKLMFEEAIRKHGNKTAIISEGRRILYSELSEASNKMANALLGWGIKKGDRIAIWLPNCPEFAIAYFGIIKTGGIAVPLDPRYRTDELVSICNNCAPAVLISDSPLLEPLMSALSGLKYLRQIVNISPSRNGRFVAYGDIMAGGSTRQVEIEVKPEDVAQIAYTSGPTVNPRGAMLTHGSVVAEVTMAASAFRQTDKDKVMLFALPLHHQFGLIAILLSAVYSGSSVVMVRGISISSVLEVIEREQATIFVGVPYVFALAMVMAEKEGIKSDIHSIRLWVSGGSPLLPEIITRFKKQYGSTITDVWGLTEALCFVTCSLIDGIGKFGSIGKPIAGWELKIVDDSGKELPVNHPGEIIVKGPIMKGYYNNPEATADIIKSGWLYTGDIGKMDEDGYVFFLGLKKNIIIRKGQNIYPGDVEHVLLLHPKVAWAKVTRVSDEYKGHAVKAVIGLKNDAETNEEEIRRFCRQHMADFKLPTHMELVKHRQGS
ncbi:MAG: AMP-binding protein [Chloroflexi bacterium]|nr:AMP-binding protein [Chloroflexota bacterium]